MSCRGAVTGGKEEPFRQGLDAFWPVWRLGNGVLPAALDPVAAAAHFQNVDAGCGREG